MTGVQKYDPSKGLGPFDKILLRAAGSRKSPNEMSIAVGGSLTAAQCAARVIELLDSRDWLSQAHQRMLLVDEMMGLKDALWEKAVEYQSVDHVKPLISVLTLIDKTLAADKFDLTKAMSEINRAHAQLMLSAIALTLERSFLELEKRYPDIEKTELLEVFHAAMPDVIHSIESKVPSE